VPAAVESAETVRYLVVAGDSLWEIARRHLEAGAGERPTSTEIDRFWRAIYAANRGVVGPDPNLIFPGQQLQIPKG
jgi:nucleoid-associated protein YgaU